MLSSILTATAVLAIFVAYYLGKRAGRKEIESHLSKRALENVKKATEAKRAVAIDPSIANSVRKRFTRR